MQTKRRPPVVDDPVSEERREDLIVDGVGTEQVQQHLFLCPRRVLPHPTIPGVAAIRLRRPRGDTITERLP